MSDNFNDTPALWTLCARCEVSLGEFDNSLCAECRYLWERDARDRADEQRMGRNGTSSSSVLSRRDDPFSGWTPPWWSGTHDEAIRELIRTHGRSWIWKASDRLLELTPAEVVEAWAADDRRCSGQLSTSLMSFAASRATAPGFPSVDAGLKPIGCRACQSEFRPAALSAAQFDCWGDTYCNVCLGNAFLGLGWFGRSDSQIVEYCCDLADVLGRIPPQRISQAAVKKLGSDDRRDRAIALLAERPAALAIKREYGSWLGALTASGLLEDGVQRMSRGIRSIADDGLVMLAHR